MRSLKIIKAALLVIIISSAIYVINALVEYKRGVDEYAEINQFMFSSESAKSEQTESSDNKSSTNEPTNDIDKSLEFKKKVEELILENENTIGWFFISGTEISYPLMQAQDNSYYLNHTFSDSVNSSGSIFLDSANDKYFSDCHSIIYGHNMKNRTMFGNIREYMKEEYFNSHKEITIYREDCVDIYEVFSAYVSAIDDKGYSILNKEFLGTEENESFVNELQTKSKFKTKTKLSGESKIITLSTCTGDTSTRYVVHAVLTDSIKYGNEK